MRADLNRTAQFFDNEYDFCLDSTFFKWEAFDNFQDALWKLQRITQHVNPGYEISSVIDLAVITKHILSKSPLDPAMVDALMELARLENVGKGSLFEEAISQLIFEANLLVETTNPMAEATIEAISEDEGIQDENDVNVPNIVLIVDRRAKQAVIDKWLPTLELDAEVKTAQEARGMSPWGTSIVFGSPELHIRSWVQNELRVKHPANWLVNAPAGFKQKIFLTEGSNSFDSKKYAPWEGAKVPSATCKVENRSQVRSEIVPLWVPEPPKSVDTSNAFHTGLVQSRPFLLPTGYWIYFSTNSSLGPKPLRVDVHDFGIETSYTDANKLANGDFLVIRSAKASRDFLRVQAYESINRKSKGSNQAATDFAALDRFKTHVQQFSNQPLALEQMVSRGMDKLAARLRINQAWDEAAIAPDSEADYKLLCSAVEFEGAVDIWPSLKRIRAAMRLAGRIAMRELVSALKEDTDWPEIVESGDMCEVSSEEFGEIRIAKIIDISNTTQDLHISNLGKLVNPDGSIYEGE